MKRNPQSGALEEHIYTGSPSSSGSKETVGTEGGRGRRRKRATSSQVGLNVKKTTPSEGKGVGGALPPPVLPTETSAFTNIFITHN